MCPFPGPGVAGHFPKGLRILRCRAPLLGNNQRAGPSWEARLAVHLSLHKCATLRGRHASKRARHPATLPLPACCPAHQTQPDLCGLATCAQWTGSQAAGCVVQLTVGLALGALGQRKRGDPECGFPRSGRLGVPRPRNCDRRAKLFHWSHVNPTFFPGGTAFGTPRCSTWSRAGPGRAQLAVQYSTHCAWCERAPDTRGREDAHGSDRRA